MKTNKFVSLITSRRFWVAITGILVVSARSIWPQFPDISKDLAGVIIPIIAYLVGTAIEPATAGQKLTTLLKSRKFWSTVAAVGIAIIRAAVPDFPMTDGEFTGLVLILSGYTVSVGVGDYVKMK